MTFNNLVVNPCAKIDEVREDEKLLGYDLFAPVRGTGMKHTIILKNKSPAAFDVVEDFLGQDLKDLKDLSEKHLVILQNLGLAVDGAKAGISAAR
jgi:hypothetical protein